MTSIVVGGRHYNGTVRDILEDELEIGLPLYRLDTI
jgi:hypothetical protein